MLPFLEVVISKYVQYMMNIHSSDGDVETEEEIHVKSVFFKERIWKIALIHKICMILPHILISVRLKYGKESCKFSGSLGFL